MFGEDVEGIFEELNALTAKALGHHFGVYREPDYSPQPYAGWIILDVIRAFYPSDLGMKGCISLCVDIGEHLAALLREGTG